MTCAGARIFCLLLLPSDVRRMYVCLEHGSIAIFAPLCWVPSTWGKNLKHAAPEKRRNLVTARKGSEAYLVLLSLSADQQERQPYLMLFWYPAAAEPLLRQQPRHETPNDAANTRLVWSTRVEGKLNNKSNFVPKNRKHN